MKRVVLAAALILGVGGIAASVYALTVSFAAPEAETGNASTHACAVSDSSASGASAVKFGGDCTTSGAPASPAATGALICDNNAILGAGPTSAPSGAITVPAGDNSSVNFSQASKTYWFAPGVHTLGSGQYASIAPGNSSTFVGAPGAVLDGKNANKYAFTGHATGVTVKYLTVQNFGLTIGDNNNEGVVNHDAGHGWTISYNTVQQVAGAGVFIGSDDTVSYNCLRNNGQYGFSIYEPDGVSNVTLDHNEISGNNTYDWESHIDGCGCTGGGKFWDTHGAAITNNYVHDNLSVGIWADTNNTGFLLQNNYISGNQAEGFFYEISYNALIKNNTFVRNAITKGPTNPSFPAGAIYLSESGSDSRVAGSYGTSLDITGNVFTDNWSGVVLWENADRFCNSPANTSSGYCTMVNPSTVTLASCNSTNIANAPYYNDCRWKTQNVHVSGNTFNLTPSNIGSNCTAANGCGFNGIFSQWGSYPSWSPYQGTTVETAITRNQNNVFSSNTYNGAWNFMIMEAGNSVNWNTWRAAPYNQDAGSTKQ